MLRREKNAKRWGKILKRGKNVKQGEKMLKRGKNVPHSPVWNFSEQPSVINIINYVGVISIVYNCYIYIYISLWLLNSSATHISFRITLYLKLFIFFGVF